MPPPRIARKPRTALGERWFIEGFALGFSTEDDAMNAWLYGRNKAANSVIEAVMQLETLKEKADG